MKIKDYQFRAKKRRGLSSVVGALLFVVLMVATFAVLGVALDSQTNIVDTSRQVADTGLKKQQERFVINSIVQIPTKSLQVNVVNKGQNPSEIFTLVITNSSDFLNGYPTKTIDIPSATSFLAPNSNNPDDIIRTLNLKMDNNPTRELYQFKIISSLGTIEKLFVTCENGGCGISAGGAEGGGLFAQFLMDGPNAINTKNSTAVMFVTNTGNVTLNDVTPFIPCSSMWGVSPDVGGTADFNPCELKPLSVAKMKVGQTAVFKWDGKVTGEINDEFSFCNQARGIDPDLPLEPVFSEHVCDQVTVIDPNDCGGCGDGGDTIILIDDLLIRPALYMIIPSPFGSMGNTPGAYQGLWGVNIINPTEKPMNVSKVTIVSYPPASNDNVNLIVKGCDMTMISPTSDWSCPRANTIMWQNQLSPLPLPAYSSIPFLVTVEPGDITGKDDIDALIVQANAFTTTGSFGKSDYQSTMSDTKDVIANVYLTSTLESRIDIQSQRNDLTENVIATFNVTLADFDDFDESYIKKGAKLIVNVPRKWTEVCITSSIGFDPNPTGVCATDPRVTEFNDKSNQIIAVTSDDLGGNAVNADLADARSIVFTAKPPENEIPGSPRPYIMYVLADGLSGNDFQIGPLNEIALIVQPAP